MDREIHLSFGPLPQDAVKRFVWNSCEWWEWFTAFRRLPSATSIHKRLSEYDGFISFHGTRPVDVESYYKSGLKIADLNELNETARKLLRSDRHPEITEEILENAIASASRFDEQKLFLVIDERELSGHYMIYGSEHICGIAASMVREAGFDCREILKRFGTPTLFRVCLPREIIPDEQLKDLADYMRTVVWETRKRKLPPSIDWTFTLKEPIPGAHIVDHTHPEKIPDPLTYYIPYRYRDDPPDFI